MIEASDGLPGHPSSDALLRAPAHCVHVYRLGPSWIVTRDPAEPAVWMIPANQNLPRHAGR
jgi:hypothetical protein